MRSVDFSIVTFPVPTTSLWPRDAADPCELLLRYDFFNSLCQSCTPPNILQGDNRKVYLSLGAVAREKWVADGHPTIWEQDEAFSYSPLLWAKTLCEVGFAVGFIFDDDPSVVVWPTGDTDLVGGHSAVVYCAQVRPSLWHYKPFAISDAVSTTVAKTARTVDLQPQKGTLLNLPSELRNLIYDASLEHNELDCGPDPAPCLLEMRVPALCSTCHQIRDEFAPIYLSSRQWSIGAQIDGQEGPRKPADSIFSPANYWLMHLPVEECVLVFDIDVATTRKVSRAELAFRKSSWSRTTRIEQYEDLLRELIDMLLEDGDKRGLTMTDLVAIMDFCLQYHGPPD
ncbi:hypothetical protein LTR78_003738 [Recurvomyces mirabilis]|uniref:Uncharacterized protein n=1 Tax=Recurvomyces mirabilis TaxID=574656 RepID=A0AAE0WRC8_9PEZI|nr:hypothetical protein LTR78_003738 [Recurvomyces mirabilis]